MPVQTVPPRGLETSSTLKRPVSEMETVDSAPNPASNSGGASTVRRFPIWIWFATIAISFIAGRYFLMGHNSDRHLLELDPSQTPSVPEGRIVVTTAPVMERTVQRSVQAVGTFFGFEELVLSSKVEGRVSKIYCDLASVVKPGELLLQLDPTDAQLAVQQAERNLQTELSKWGFQGVPDPNAEIQTLPGVVSAKLRFDLAASRLKRIQQLYASNAVSADELEQAVSESQVAESEWKSQSLLANSAVATSRLRAADLEIAKQRLLDCEIRVPTPSISEAGRAEYYTVSERLVSEGTLLRPGTEVFRLILGKALKLRLTVPESNAAQIQLHQTVLVHIAASSTPERGTITNISPVVDRSTRTFLVEVTVPNESGLCKPGGFAKADVLTSGDVRALTVPLESLYSLAGNQKIFLIEDGKAHEVIVSLGEQTAEWVEIATPPISAGAKVATSGQRLLSEGLLVSERQEGNAKASQAQTIPQDKSPENKPSAAPEVQ